MEKKLLRNLTVGTTFIASKCGTWKEITTQGSIPRRRSYHTSISWRNTIFILGGQDLREGALEGLWMLRIDPMNQEGERWVKLKLQNGPGALSRHTAVVTNNNMYVYGGTNTILQFNTMYILDLEKMMWRMISPIGENFPPKMDSHSCVVYNKNLIFFAGYISGYRSSSIHLYEIGSDTWERKEIAGPCPRSNHSAVVFGWKMYVFGGLDEDHSTLNDFWSLNLENWTWHNIALKGDVPPPRSGHTMLLYKNTFILFGGIKEIGHETNEMFYCNLQNFEWEVIFHGEANQIKHKTVVKSFVTEPINSLDLARGINFSKKIAEEVKDSHSKPIKENERIIPVPCARDGHSANIIDNKMYIFAGDKHQMSFNDFHVYSMDT